MKKITNLLILIYQNTFSNIFRFFFGPGCRYLPTCSEYSKIAIKKFGIIRGTILSLKRLSRCHPWGDYGFDPVPEKI